MDRERERVRNREEIWRRKKKRGNLNNLKK
jgi:hypothetical protein